nr:HopJ type III effector protein [Oceanobacter mangrovi]
MHSFLEQLPQADFEFATTLAFIEQWYDFTATGFQNGTLRNEADQNQGSCRVLAMATSAGLSNEQTLLCFGEHYRDVLAAPAGDSHQNIRQLQQQGLQGVEFDQFPLTAKQHS